MTGSWRGAGRYAVAVDRRNGRFVVRFGHGVPVRELQLRDGLVMEVHR